MVVLKEITEDSWLVLENDAIELGLLSITPTGAYTLVNDTGKHSFPNVDQLYTFFENDIFNHVDSSPVTIEKSFFVKGYPINYHDPVEADLVSDLPLFKKTHTSEVYHCAGYYCIRFPKGWISVFCPKLSTLSKYDYQGPFLTDLKAKVRLKELRKADK